MNQYKNTFLALSLTVLVFTLSLSALGQNETGPPSSLSYDVVLQIITGTNDTGLRGELPQNLSAVSKQLRGNFPFANYTLANTYLGRIADNGALNYKSVSDILRQNSLLAQPSFVEWALGNLKTSPNAKGDRMLQAQQFRFGARIPLSLPRVDESGKVNSIINYEAIGLDLNRVSLPENVPTLIGTLTLPNTSGTLFLVMTAKPVEY